MGPISNNFCQIFVLMMFWKSNISVADTDPVFLGHPDSDPAYSIPDPVKTVPVPQLRY